MKEPGMHERVAARADEGREPRLGRRQPGDPLRERVVCRRDVSEQAERALGDGGQPRARALHLRGERRLRARQRILADERAIAHRREDVVEQRFGWNRRPQRERRLRETRARPSRSA